VLYERLAARGRKVEAPEFVRPAGAMRRSARPLKPFSAPRAHRGVLGKCDFDFASPHGEHPLAGQVSAYEFILIWRRIRRVTHGQIQEGRGR